MADVPDSSNYDSMKDNIRKTLIELQHSLGNSININIKINKILEYIDSVKSHKDINIEFMKDLDELNNILLNVDNNRVLFSELKNNISNFKEKFPDNTSMKSLLKYYQENQPTEEAAEAQQQKEFDLETLKNTLIEIVPLLENNNKKVSWFPSRIKNTSIKTAIDTLNFFITNSGDTQKNDEIFKLKLKDAMAINKLNIAMNIITANLGSNNSIIKDENERLKLIDKIDALSPIINALKVHVNGGKKSKKLPKKEILGKIRCIYKIPGDRKEYLKHKGKLITVKEYKELIKTKSKK
tara:strand:+ start:350 stop:1237 length:888 start_codon:yes stop_codon:yes gene_type:complete